MAKKRKLFELLSSEEGWEQTYVRSLKVDDIRLLLRTRGHNLGELKDKGIYKKDQLVNYLITKCLLFLREDHIKVLTVKQLKLEMKLHEIPVKGNKTDLMDLLINHTKKFIIKSNKKRKLNDNTNEDDDEETETDEDIDLNSNINYNILSYKYNYINSDLALKMTDQARTGI